MEIAARTGATVIGIFEVCQWLSAHGVKSVHAMNLGGGYSFAFGRLTMTLALHSSSMPDGSYARNPCGFILRGRKARFTSPATRPFFPT